MLHFVAEIGEIRTLKLLLKGGEISDSVDENNKTPLHWAVFGGHEDSVSYLINYNSKLIGAIDKDKETPLFEAMWKGHTGIVRLLQKKGANFYAKNKYGWMPLHIAAIYCQVKIFESLNLSNGEYNKLKELDTIKWDDYFESKEPCDLTKELVKRLVHLEKNFTKYLDKKKDFPQCRKDHNQSKLVDYISHINLSKGTETMDKELKDAIEILELKIRTNIILWHFKKAIDALKENENFEIKKNKKYDKEISKLLNGEGVTINANIRESNSEKSAIKFNEIGKSYYRYKDRFYVIKNDEQSIKKTKSGEPVRKNTVYEKLKNGELMFSSYTAWTVKIESIKVNDFSKLKTFEKELNLELVGHGKYIKTKGNNGLTLEVEKYYQRTKFPIKIE
ncbi:7614_t:CDS:2 [Dentiscutata erythropus]|uniref:7614_t:CDS:1 n=1 Tax=Dentiscutata erythropus TaxID=1348616 RepID=A0A9N8ZR47_9GLOM|nr:7614_t:CDS:2 [Dentiscutata erythropus]